MKSAHSLRHRLILYMALTTAAALIGGGWYAYRLYELQLREAYDRILRHKLRVLRAATVQDGNSVSVRLNEEALRAMAEPDDRLHFQIRGEDYAPILSSDELGALNLPVMEGTDAVPTFRDATLEDGTPVRYAGQWFLPLTAPNSETAGFLQQANICISQSQKSMYDSFDKLRRTLWRAGLATLAFMALVAVILIRKALRPLEQLSAEIKSIPPDGSQRFSQPKMAAELVPVVTRLNGLMDGVERALATEREFTSNAAHELRTPLAGLRAKLELALSRPRDAVDYRAALQEGLAIERRLQALVENLLLLARLRGTHKSFAPKLFSLPKLLARCWGEFFDEAEARGLHVALHVPEDARVSTVEDLLAIAVRNLFDNAVSYTPEGGLIDIRARRNGDRWEIIVANSNSPSGLQPTHLGHIFTPFWRGARDDESSTRHAGIGLPLCRRVMEELGGTISLEVTEKNMVVAMLSFPG